VYRQR